MKRYNLTLSKIKRHSEEFITLYFLRGREHKIGGIEYFFLSSANLNKSRDKIYLICTIIQLYID